MRNVLNYFDGVHGSESYIVPRQPTRGYKNLKTHTRTGSTLRSDGLLLIKHNTYLFSLSPDAYIKSYKLRESIDEKKTLQYSAGEVHTAQRSRLHQRVWSSTKGGSFSERSSPVTRSVRHHSSYS